MRGGESREPGPPRPDRRRGSRRSDPGSPRGTRAGVELGLADLDPGAARSESSSHARAEPDRSGAPRRARTRTCSPAPGPRSAARARPCPRSGVRARRRPRIEDTRHDQQNHLTGHHDWRNLLDSHGKGRNSAPGPSTARPTGCQVACSSPARFARADPPPASAETQGDEAGRPPRRPAGNQASAEPTRRAGACALAGSPAPAPRGGASPGLARDPPIIRSTHRIVRVPRGSQPTE